MSTFDLVFLIVFVLFALEVLVRGWTWMLHRWQEFVQMREALLEEVEDEEAPA